MSDEQGCLLRIVWSRHARVLFLNVCFKTIFAEIRKLSKMSNVFNEVYIYINKHTIK